MTGQDILIVGNDANRYVKNLNDKTPKYTAFPRTVTEMRGRIPDILAEYATIKYIILQMGLLTL